MWVAPGQSAPGEFHVPHGVWVHTDGRVFVADRENNRIQIFSPEGEFLSQWKALARPCDIYIDHEGVVYVPELGGVQLRRARGMGDMPCGLTRTATST
jgi:hypothetical protein